MYIQQNIAIAPWLIFGLLLLAGFNLPVSEDVMLFVSGILAAKNPEYSTDLFIAVFLGAYFSDIICYAFLGRFLGEKIFKIKFFSKLVTQKRIEKVGRFYKSYGVLTLILGRFVPFGLRNTLFFTAGVTKMNPIKFCLSDLLACSISTIFFFNLYKNYGEEVIEYVKKGNIIIFSIFLIVVIIYWLKNKRIKTNSYME